MWAMRVLSTLIKSFLPTYAISESRLSPIFSKKLPIFLSSSSETGCLFFFLMLPIFLALCDMRFPTGGGLAQVFRFPVSSECFRHFSRSRVEFTHKVTATATASSITVAGTSCTQTENMFTLIPPLSTQALPTKRGGA